MKNNKGFVLWEIIFLVISIGLILSFLSLKIIKDLNKVEENKEYLGGKEDLKLIVYKIEKFKKNNKLEYEELVSKLDTENLCLPDKNKTTECYNNWWNFKTKIDKNISNLDFWGNPYMVEKEKNKKCVEKIWSLGPDQKNDTDDDIVLSIKNFNCN